jgi:DNA-binding NtrC family response regulator
MSEPDPPRQVSDRVPEDVLVVEDLALISLDLELMLEISGVASVRNARNVREAMTAIDQRVPDFTLLDIRLDNETSLPVAKRLRELGARFAFVTGTHDRHPFGNAFQDVPTIRKPFDIDALRAVLNWRRPG